MEDSVPITPEAPEDKGLGETIVGRLLEPKTLLKDALTGFGRLYDKNPRTFGLTAVGLLVLLVAPRFAGVDLLWFMPQVVHIPAIIENLPVARDVTWVGDLSSHRECIAKAKALSRKYVLLNVVQWIQYDDSPNREQRVVEQRIVYTVLPLVDIAANEQVFAEDYQGSGSVAHWYGPRRETLIQGTSRYQISFVGKKGVPLTIITGAQMFYQLPLANRPAFRSKTLVTASQDFWAYENTEDVICEITQVVDSRSLVLTPVGFGGHRIGNDGKHLEGEVIAHPLVETPMPNSVLSSTWTLVVPGEDVGIVFGWRVRTDGH